MTSADQELAPLVCPIHGQLTWEHVTTIKTCGLCMEEMGCAATDATTLQRGVEEETMEFEGLKLHEILELARIVWANGNHVAVEDEDVVAKLVDLGLARVESVGGRSGWSYMSAFMKGKDLVNRARGENS